MNINDTLQYMRFPIPEDILRRKMHGDYEGAIRLIDRRLQEADLPEPLRCSLLVQKKICCELPGEFPYSREDALAIIRTDIPDFTEEELEELVDQRKIRWIYVNGEERYFKLFYDSLCKAVPEFSLRVQQKTGSMESLSATKDAAAFRDATIEKMKKNGSMTVRIRVRSAVKLKDEFFTPGMFLRVHLPVAAKCDQQTKIQIEKIQPEGGMVSPENSGQRTVCWEGNFPVNQEFLVEYSYLHTAKYKDAYHATGISDSYEFDVQEQPPHIVFSPYIRSLCREITDGITDSLAKAREYVLYFHAPLCSAGKFCRKLCIEQNR